jgi:raffinose/stachyose/melibiose transport system substrate-binding protein
MTRRASTRRILSTSTALVAISALSACGLAGGDDSGSASDEVVFWHAFTAGAESGAIKSILDGFGEAQDSYTVKDRGIGNEEHFTVVRTGLAGGAPPDMVHYEGYQQTRDFAEAGQLLDLTDFWEEHEDKFILKESAVRACTYDGKIYCIPYTFHSGFQMYYNAEILEQEGIEPPQTFEDFTAAAETLKGAGLTPVSIGAKDGWPAEHWWMNFIVQRCGVAHVYDVIDDKGAKFTDECFVQAAEDLAGLAEAGYFPEGASSDDYGAAISVFASKKAGFMQTGSWYAAELLETPTDFEYGIIPFPRFQDAENTGDITGAVTHVFGIPAKADNPDGAKALLEHMLTEESTATWAEAGLFSLVDGAVEQNGPEDVMPLWDAVLQADASLPWLENELPPGVGEDAIYNGSAALVAGRMTPQEFVESIQAALDKARQGS